jgi:hypothetical protein
VADSAVLAGKVIRPKCQAAPAVIGGRGPVNAARPQDQLENGAKGRGDKKGGRIAPGPRAPDLPIAGEGAWRGGRQTLSEDEALLKQVKSNSQS